MAQRQPVHDVLGSLDDAVGIPGLRVIVLGEVHGNVTASEKVDIRDGGSVDGDIVSPRVAIAEGAHFRGSVDMQRKSGLPQGQAKPATTAATTPAPAPAAASPAPQKVGA